MRCSNQLIKTFVYFAFWLFIFPTYATDVTLIWGDVSGATHYQIQKDNAGNWENVAIQTTTNIDIGVLEDGTYQYRVGACLEEPGVAIHCGDKFSEYISKQFTIDSTIDATVQRTIGMLSAAVTSVPDATPTNLTRPKTSSVVGQLAGESSINGGSVSYRIPIQVPPGRRGMQPNLNFGYSSNGGKGTAGKGWSLSGLSNISRCSANWTEDGKVTRTNLSNQDMLCLDGQKLVKVSSGSYGAVNTEYRTLNESFRKITLKGGSYSSSASYFEVIEKSGRINYYGNTTDSLFIPVGSTVPNNWAINKSIDNVVTQNNIVYEYHNAQGEHYLEDIYYTGQNAIKGNRRVNFVYEDRSDNSFGYISGASYKTTQRLSKVTTYVGTEEVFEYDLVYEANNSPSTGISRLASIQQCGYDDTRTKQCLPAKEFTFSGSALTFESHESTNTVFNNAAPWALQNQILGDFNQDGVMDFVRNDHLHLMSFENNQYVYDRVLDLPFAVYDSVRFPYEKIVLGQLDYNNDGRQDMIGIMPNGYLGIAELNGDNTGFVTHDLGLPLQCVAITTISSTYIGTVSVDTNFKHKNHCRADAIPDGTGGYYLFHRSAGSDLYLSRINTSCSNNICSTQVIPGIDTEAGILDKYEQQPADYQFIDFDGDGDPDIVRIEEVGTGENDPIKLVVFTNNETGDGASATNSFVKSEHSLPGLTKKYGMASGGHHWIDANGDGLPDLLVNSDDWYLVINKGGTLAAPVDTGIDKFVNMDVCMMDCGLVGPEHSTHSSIRITDYNGDGLEDFMFLNGDLNTRNCLSDRERALCKEGSGSEPPHKDDFSISPLAFGTYSVYVSQLDASGNVSFDRVDTTLKGSISFFYPTDINSDGVQDYIGAIWQDDNTTVDRLGGDVQVFFQLGKFDENYQQPDLLTRVIDDFNVISFDSKELFEYKSYSQHKLALNESAQVNNSDLAGKNYYRIPSTQAVVTRHRYKNAISGLNEKTYSYGAPVYHQAGLGLLGFESITEVDLSQGTTSVTNYEMEYPLNGKVSNHTLYESSDNSILQTLVNTWCDASTTDCNGTEASTWFTHLNQSITNFYDPDGGLLKIETVVNNGFDIYGNITQRTSTVSDSTTTHTTVLDSDYFAADESLWWVDKLDYSTVTKSVTYVNDQGIVADTNGNKSQTRTITWKSNNARQLATETVTASDTDIESVTTYNTYDSYGNLTKITRSGSADSQITYTDVQSNQVNEYDYADSSGYFVNREKNGIWTGYALTRSWDSRFGQVLTETDINGISVTNGYDAFGRVISVNNSVLPQQDIIYQWCSSCINSGIMQITTMQDGAPTQIQEFNRAGQLVRQKIKSFSQNILAEQETIQTITYDALGRIVTRKFPHFLGHTASSETLANYDVLDRPGKRTVKNSPQIYTVTYDYNQLTTDIEVNAGVSGTLYMSRTYNALNQLLSTTDANSKSTHFRYDASGNAIVVKDVDGNVISAKHDGFGNKQWFDDPNMGRWEFRYNGLGQLRWQKDANLTETRFTYDGLSRQTQRDIKLSTGNWEQSASWVYDTKKYGSLTSESNPNSSKTYEYDAQIRVTKETTQIHNQLITKSFDLEYAYDGYYGRMKAMKYPSGELVGFEYDQYGFSTNDIDPNNNNEVYRSVKSVSRHGNITSQQFRNGLYGMTAFTRSGDVERVCVNDFATCVGEHSLDEIYYSDYDHFGNLKQMDDLVNEISESFVYDNLMRITSSTRTATGFITPTFTPAATINYNYDASGNLTRKSDYANTYSYTGGTTGGANAVKSITKLDGSTVNFNYDDNGNLLTGDGLTMEYNHFNKPIEIIRNNVTLAFQYSADEMRNLQVATHVNKTVTTYYVGKVFEQIETSENGTTTIEKRHYFGDYAVLTHKDVYKTLNFLHRDRLGSTSLITNGYGHTNEIGSINLLVLERRGYDVFGKARDLYWGDSILGKLSSNISNRGFTDHEHLDDAQLIHMNGRVYDYNLGRFASVDPFIQEPGNSQSINPYSYIMNNPLSGVDPSGYSAFKKNWISIYPASKRKIGGSAGNQNNNTGSGTGIGAISSSIGNPTPGPIDEFIAQTEEFLAEIDETIESFGTNVGGTGDAGFSLPQSGSTDDSWSFGDPLPQGVVDFAAGWGDTLSFGLTSLIRTQMGTNGVVDQYSASYYGGMGFGAVNGLGFGWTAGLNGGAKTVFWSGAGNLERAGKLGTSLEKTPIGALMNKIGEPVPYFMWKAASATFAANAKGTAIKVGAKQGNIWSKIEKPILEFRNIPVKQIK